MGSRARTSRVEWSVRWRRDNWKATTFSATRRFAREADLDNFIGKLHAAAHLAPLKQVDVYVRSVGPWERVDDDEPRIPRIPGIRRSTGTGISAIIADDLPPRSAPSTAETAR